MSDFADSNLHRFEFQILLACIGGVGKEYVFRSSVINKNDENSAVFNWYQVDPQSCFSPLIFEFN
jgi:hypothetical protein